MTETQAKSAAAGADTEAAHGQAPETDKPETPPGAPESAGAASTGAASTAAEPTDSASSSSESSSTVIRRAPSTESRIAAEAKAETEPDGRSPYRAAPPASEPLPESSPTTRLSPGEAAARAESVVRPATGGRTASTSTAPTPTGPAGPVGRATVTGAPTRPATRTAPGGAGPRGAGAVTSAAAVGAARVSETLRTARATVAGAASRGPRRARLHLKRIDPWSVMKFSFAVSLVLFVVAIVATSVLYLALDAMNVFDSVNSAVGDITGQTGAEATGFRITAKGVIGTAVLLGAVNMVLFTALATLGAFVYNVCADLVGGIELTLSEKE